jgi:mannose-6-phosphate isomerase-like protein (cupin superfamily)
MIGDRLLCDQEARMPDVPYRIAHVSEVATPAGVDPGEAPWRAVRSHFGVGSFGVSAYVAEAAGDQFTSEHTELDTRHEELFFVASGRAALSIAGETVDAPAGTFVYISDPAVSRGARAVDAGTTLIVVGGEPGRSFEVSQWELEHVDG